MSVCSNSPPSLSSRPTGPLSTASKPTSDELTAAAMGSKSMSRHPHLRFPFRPRRASQRLPHRATGMYAGIGDRIDERKLNELFVDTSAYIKDVGLAGGYKWITDWSPNEDGCDITVPGVPDVWRGDEREVKKLPHDAELEGNTVFSDYNQAATPRGVSPHETVFISLVSPEALRDIEVITSRNNLKKLLVSCGRNLQASKTPRDREDDYVWRIEAWVVPGTDLVLLDRWESPASLRAQEGTSFHLAYHEATTTKLQVGSDRTPGCQRLISYTFGGIKMIVKCDIDAAFPWDIDPPDVESVTTVLEDAVSDISMPALHSEMPSDGSRITGLTNETDRFMILSLEEIARLSDSDAEVCQHTSTGIKVHHEPLPHPPHEKLISIKTRQWRKGQSLEGVNHLDAIFANIFWAQVPTLIVGWHRGGDFSVAPPSEFRLGEGPLKELEERHQPAISKVRELLGWMLSRTWEHSRVAFICDGHIVEAYKLETSPAQLSEEARAIVEQAGLKRTD